MSDTAATSTDAVNAAESTALNAAGAYKPLAVLVVVVLSVLVPILFARRDAPTVVHNATPTPEQDAVVGDAVVADIDAGLVPLVGG